MASHDLTLDHLQHFIAVAIEDFDMEGKPFSVSPLKKPNALPTLASCLTIQTDFLDHWLTASCGL